MLAKRIVLSRQTKSTRRSARMGFNFRRICGRRTRRRRNSFRIGRFSFDPAFRRECGRFALFAFSELCKHERRAKDVHCGKMEFPPPRFFAKRPESVARFFQFIVVVKSFANGVSPCHYDRMGCGAAVVDAPRIAAAVHAEVCAIISGKFDRALAHHKFQLGHALGDVPVFFSVCAAPFSLDAGARIRRVRTIACFGAAAAAAAAVASPPPAPSFLLTQLLSWRRQRRRFPLAVPPSTHEES